MGTGGGIGIDGNHDSAWNRSTQTFTNPSPLHRSNVHTPTADLQFRGTTPRAAAQGLRPCARSEVRGRRSAPERFARVTGIWPASTFCQIFAEKGIRRSATRPSPKPKPPQPLRQCSTHSGPLTSRLRHQPQASGRKAGTRPPTSP